MRFRSRQWVRVLTSATILLVIGTPPVQATGQTKATTIAANGATLGKIEVRLEPKVPTRLHITIRPGAKAAKTVPRYRLPWTSRYSMVFVAVRPNGEPIDMNLPVDDPASDGIPIPAGASLTGEINLEWIIKDLDQVIRQSDIHLFWAYESPEELRIPHWSGGWILVPQQK